MKYFDELKRSMTWLGQQENTLFLGQAVAYPGTGMTNTLTEVSKDKLIEMPVNEDMQMGMTIGMALNGVPLFNDREGGNVSLDAMTITTFDYSGAHPAPSKNYHYHTTGRYTSMDDAKLIGFLRDGFPIYGRKDTTGIYPTLDSYGGHFGPTQDFTSGIYHYHASNVNYLNTGYYILKAGSYYGTKGTFTN